LPSARSIGQGTHTTFPATNIPGLLPTLAHPKTRPERLQPLRANPKACDGNLRPGASFHRPPAKPETDHLCADPIRVLGTEAVSLALDRAGGSIATTGPRGRINQQIAMLRDVWNLRNAKKRRAHQRTSARA